MVMIGVRRGQNNKQLAGTQLPELRHGSESMSVVELVAVVHGGVMGASESMEIHVLLKGRGDERRDLVGGRWQPWVVLDQESLSCLGRLCVDM